MLQTTEYKLSDVEVNLLEEIRNQAKKMRSLPRIDIFKACDLVRIDFELITPEILSVFIRSLSQAFGRPVNFSEAGARRGLVAPTKAATAVAERAPPSLL